MFYTVEAGFQITDNFSMQCVNKKFGTGQLSALPPNHYKFSINLSGDVADLVRFLISTETPHLSGTLCSRLKYGDL